MSDTYAYSLTDEVAMTFIAAISDELAPTGLALTLLSAAPREGIIPARDVAVDGALVYSCDLTSPAVGWLMRRRLPVVFVDQPPASGIASINVDDRGGARAAAQHVLDLGHRRVGIVTSGFGGQYGIVADPRAATLAYGESQRCWAGSRRSTRPGSRRAWYGSRTKTRTRSGIRPARHCWRSHSGPPRSCASRTPSPAASSVPPRTPG